MASRNDLVDKVGPVMGPFLLQNGNEDEIKFIEQSSLSLEVVLRTRVLNNKIDNKVADAYSSISVSEGLLSCHTRQAYLDTDREAIPSILS